MDFDSYPAPLSPFPSPFTPDTLLFSPFAFTFTQLFLLSCLSQPPLTSSPVVVKLRVSCLSLPGLYSSSPPPQEWTVPQLSVMIIYNCTWSILIQQIRITLLRDNLTQKTQNKDLFTRSKKIYRIGRSLNFCGKKICGKLAQWLTLWAVNHINTGSNPSTRQLPKHPVNLTRLLCLVHCQCVSSSKSLTLKENYNHTLYLR